MYTYLVNNQILNMSLSLKNLASNRYSNQILSQLFTYQTASGRRMLTFQRNEIIYNGKVSILINVRDVTDIAKDFYSGDLGKSNDESRNFQ